MGILVKRLAKQQHRTDNSWKSNLNLRMYNKEDIIIKHRDNTVPVYVTTKLKHVIRVCASYRGTKDDKKLTWEVT